MSNEDAGQSANEGPNASGNIPDRLARDLARLHRADAGLQIPASVDEHIRLLARHRLTEAGSQRSVAAARQNAEHVRRRRLAAIRWVTASGIAAVLILTGVLLPRLGMLGTTPTPPVQSGPLAKATNGSSPRPAGAASAREDINNDGVVDILDAQRLAFLLRTNGPRDQGNWDLNNDGVVNDADAKVIAQHVVDIKKNGGAG